MAVSVLLQCALSVLLYIPANATTDSVSVGKDSVTIKSNGLRTVSSSSFTEGLSLQAPQYIPKTPNVSSLVSQLDYPVSLYTGVPNISVPIYVIETDGIQIPISLSYNASGIRAGQEASWVGLGWSLNAGGIISRTIRCGDDFHEYAPPGGTLTEGYITSPEITDNDIGTLKYVTTPTKGKTTFVYEAKRYKTTPRTSIVTHHKKEAINVFNEYNYDTYSQYPKTITRRITLSVPTSMSLYGFAENEGCTEDKDVRYDNDENATLKISKINGDGSKQLVFYYPTPSEMKTECSYTFPFRTIELSEGDFVIEAEAHAKDTWYSFSYEYSKTEAITSDSIITGGGLRIKNIYGAEYKSYEYDGGKLLVDPVFGIKRRFEEYYHQPYSTLPVLCRTDYMVQQSDATIPMSTLKDGNILGYTLVKEKVGDTTVSHYFHNEKEESQDEEHPYTPTRYNAFNGIEEKTVQDKRTTVYSYDTRKAKDIKAFIFNEENGEIYPYTYEIEWPLLSQVTTTTKEENGNIVTTNAYTYNDNFMKETESISDVSGTYTKKHIYPKNGDTGILGTMANRYMTGVPVETLLLLDNKVIDGHRTSYINIGDLILPDEEYRITGVSGLPLSEYDSSYISELKYSHYNSYGKPMQLDGKGISTVYLWSYDGTCPVAEIRNTTYTEVSATLSATFIDNITKKHVPADSDMSILNSLREKLPHAMVFTYTYIPLIGMTSITDERGFTIYYDYDASGRLYEKYIMTGGKKSVMERYRYNYRQ